MPDLLLQFASVILLLGGFVVLWWAMVRDRARGRRRCPKCWYDLRATPGMRCSECGYAARVEREFFATRRHWRAAAVGLLLIAVGWAVVLAKVHQRGLRAMVPTTALIAVIPWTGDGWVFEELWERGNLWEWQKRYAERQAMTAVAPPRSVALREAAMRFISVRQGAEQAAIFAVDWLEDPDPVIRAAGVRQIAMRLWSTGRSPEPAVAQHLIGGLLRVLEDEAGVVRLRATSVLSHAGRDSPEIVEALTHMLTDPIETVRVGARSALIRLGPDAAPVIPMLIEYLRRDDSTAEHAAEVLIALEHGLPARESRRAGSPSSPASAATPVLIELLEGEGRSPNPLWGRVIEAIGPEAAAATPVLKRILEESEDDVPAWTRSLGAIGPAAREVTPVLLDLLDHDDPVIRAEAILALCGLGAEGEAHWPRLLSALEGPTVGRALLDSRLWMRDWMPTETTVSILIALLERLPADDPLGVHVRISAVQGMQSYPQFPYRLVGPLTEALAHPWPEVRHQAAQSLRAFGSEARAALPALYRALDMVGEGPRIGTEVIRDGLDNRPKVTFFTREQSEIPASELEPLRLGEELVIRETIAVIEGAEADH